MAFILAIYGQSCVGKTSVTNELGRILDLPVRHCGEIIKRRAQELGINPSELSPLDHQAIDKETRAMAIIAQTTTIIEGGFLDIVLAGLDNVHFIHLICDQRVRESRYLRRDGDADISGLEIRDAADAAHRAFLSEPSVEAKERIIDTSTITVDQVVTRILDWFSEADSDKA
jgi:cytidylate kinase